MEYAWTLFGFFMVFWQLKARYGGSYVFTISTSSEHEEEVESLVQNLSPNSSKVYQLSGTQKFELPKNEVKIADVFQVVEQAKSKFRVFAWGLVDTSLEDVFIKVAREAHKSRTWLWLLNMVWYFYFGSLDNLFGVWFLFLICFKEN